MFSIEEQLRIANGKWVGKKRSVVGMRVENKLDRYASWKEITDEWGLFSHPMIGMRPVVEEVKGERVVCQLVDKTVKEWAEWQPEEGFFWVGQRVNLRMLKGFVYPRGEHMMQISGHLEELVEHHPHLFNSLQVTAARYLGGVPSAVLSFSFKKTHDRMISAVYLVSNSPSIKDIEAFPGKIKTSFFSFVVGEHEIHLCSEPESLDHSITVEEVVKITWQRYAHRLPISSNFLSETTYKYDRTGYDNWSYDTHVEQIKKVMADLPLDMPITAPGDGVGIVQAAAVGRKVLSGDLFPAGSAVTREPFIETLKRAEGCIILSYVIGLMSETELMWLSKWQGPIVVIDAKHSVPIAGMQQIEAGVFYKGLSSKTVKDVSVEGMNTEIDIKFSENLLRLESISSKEDNIATMYWQKMRPFGKRDDRSPIIASSLAEWLLYGNKWPKEQIWLMPAGSFVKQERIGSLVSGSSMEIRIVYYVLSPLPESIKMKVNWAVMGDWTFFISPFAQEIEFEDGKISFGSKEQLTGIILLSLTEREIIWNVTGKVVVWARNELTEILADRYQTVYGKLGWQNSFTFGVRWGEGISREFMDRDEDEDAEEHLTPFEWFWKTGSWLQFADPAFMGKALGILSHGSRFCVMRGDPGEIEPEQEDDEVCADDHWHETV